MIAAAKSLTATGAYLIRQAKQLARSLFTTGMRSQVKIIDGYLLRASRAGNIANCTVIDPPGLIVALSPDGDSRGAPLGCAYGLQPRDFYSTSLDLPHVTFTLETTNPSPLGFVYFPVGFSFQDGPDGSVTSPLDKAGKVRREVVHASTDRYVRGWLGLITNPDIGAPNYDVLPASTPEEPRTSQIFATVAVMSSQTVFADGRNTNPYTGYSISDEAIAEMAPGYVLIREAEFGYSGWVDGGMSPPAGAMVGPLMIVAIPVTKQGGIGVTDWGEAAMLIIGLSSVNADGKPDGALIRWHRLWTPADHPQPALHPGPWVYEPDYKPSYNQEQWDDAWHYEVGQLPHENLGSRPSATDCLSCQPDGDGVLFRFRYSTIAGVPHIFALGAQGFHTAEVESVIELHAAVDGTITATYPSHEVFTSTSNPYADEPYSPYQQFVVGILPIDKVKVVIPMATLTAGDSLVRLDAEYTADRSGIFDPYLSHEWAGNMVNPDTDNFGFRIKSAAGEWVIPFSSIGAGFAAPVFKFMGVTDVLYSSLGYKIWDVTCLAAVFSSSEIAVLVFEDWQNAGSFGDGTHTKIVVINVVDGTFRTLPRTGYYHAKTTACREMPVLSVAQQEVRNDGGEVIQKAVLLVSGARSSRVHISRDSGETWDYLLDFIAPMGGSFYLGNTLTSTVKPGDAQVIR